MRLRIVRKVFKRAFADPKWGFANIRLFIRAAARWRKSSKEKQRRRDALLCDHKHWRGVRLDGRSCSCGTLLFDPGD